MPDYTSLFEVFGVYARAFSQFKNLARRNLTFSAGGEIFRSLDKLREQFADVLNDGPGERDRLECVTLLSDAARTVGAWDAQLESSLDAFVREGLADALDVSGATREAVLAELSRAMNADGESVARNVISLGAVSVAATNVGTEKCYVSKSTVDPAESVVDDERAQDQSIALTCVRDNAHQRAVVGAEEFRIAPELGAPVPTYVIPVTIGDTQDARNVITDGAFESYSGGVFPYWPVISGGGVFSRDTGTKLFGTGSLKITGNGAIAGELQQDLVARDPAMASGRVWALGVWAYVSSLGAGTVTVDLLVNGSPSTLALTINGSTPTGQWVHLGGFVYLPRNTYPNKVKARIACSSGFNGAVFLDGVCLALATEVPHAGVRAAIFQGATAPQALPISDRFTVATTSDEAGSFQCMFRDRLGVALPSSASPTIDDTLAE
jgi:hypothetical protein